MSLSEFVEVPELIVSYETKTWLQAVVIARTVEDSKVLEDYFGEKYDKAIDSYNRTAPNYIKNKGKEITNHKNLETLNAFRALAGKAAY